MKRFIWLLPPLLFPLLLAWIWGAYFPDDVYLWLNRYFAGVGGAFFPMQTPLILVISVLGWSGVGLAFWLLGKAAERPFSTHISLLLLSFNPFILLTLGSNTAWLLAFIWLAAAFASLRRWLGLSLALLGFLAVLVIGWPLAQADWQAMAWSLLVFGAGIGLHSLLAWLSAQNRLQIDYAQAVKLIVSSAGLLLALLQIGWLLTLYQTRPFSQWQLEQEIANWLRQETAASATLLAPAKISYLAQRTAVSTALSAGSSPTPPPAANASALQDFLQTAPPDYLVSSNTIQWRNLENMAWFRLAYEPVQTFPAPDQPAAPYTIWAFRPAHAGENERIPLNVRVPDRLRILGFELWPRVAEAGGSLELLLTLQQLAATAVPPTPFTALIRLVSPVDNSSVSEWQFDLPADLAARDWRFSLPLPADLPASSYLLNLSLIGPDGSEFWPFSQDNDINPLDRITLTSIIVPDAAADAASHPLTITFGDTIRLVGYDAGEIEPGSPLAITLYWQADGPTQENLVVFVHLLDESGQLVTNQDAVPGNGRFPTTTWQPNLTIADSHLLPLPEALPAGAYQIKVGLYQPETGERLQPTDETGQQPPDKAITLYTFQFP